MIRVIHDALRVGDSSPGGIATRQAIEQFAPLAVDVELAGKFLVLAR